MEIRWPKSESRIEPDSTHEQWRGRIGDSQRIGEIVAVIMTGVGKFVFMDLLNLRLPFIVAAILFWTGYVMFRSKRTPGITSYWGFRADNFPTALKLVLPFALVSIVLFFSIGLYLGTINIMWHIIPVLLLYPVWGTIQQFLVIGLVAGNLSDLHGRIIPRPVIILLTALLFGFLHYPSYWLMLGTFALALFYGVIFLKQRNVYVLGLFHGWLGALFFYTVVGRDPFKEVLGKLLNLE